MKKKITITILVALGLFLGITQVLAVEIFGNSGVGSFSAVLDDEVWGLKAYLPETGEITKMSVRIRPAENADMVVAIYDDTGNLKATSSVKALIATTTESWIDFDISTTLNEGWYWLVLLSPRVGDTIYVDKEVSAGGLIAYNFYPINALHPLEFSETINFANFENDRVLSVYATYELPPPPPPPPPPYIELDESFPAGIVSYVRAFVGSGIAPLLAVFIGIPFAFVVIRKVIDLMPKK